MTGRHSRHCGTTHDRHTSGRPAPDLPLTCAFTCPARAIRTQAGAPRQSEQPDIRRVSANHLTVFLFTFDDVSQEADELRVNPRAPALGESLRAGHDGGHDLSRTTP